LKNVQNETTKCFLVGSTKINNLPIKANIIYKVRQIFLLETAVKSKMFIIVLPTEKRLEFNFGHFLNYVISASNVN